MSQSPIDIITNDVVKPEEDDDHRLNINYRKDVPLMVVNDGKQVMAEILEMPGRRPGRLRIGLEEFDILQFHFHTPSEHLMDGVESLIEMHLVHESKDGEEAVIGVFMVLGNIQKELNKIFSNLPKEGEFRQIKGFSLRELLPSDLDSLQYDGSLVTPDCTEGVKWVLFTEPMEMSADQIEALMAIFSGVEFPNGNRRPTQPINGRLVLEIEE